MRPGPHPTRALMWLGLGISAALGLPSTAHAVDIIAISDLSSRGNGEAVTFPIYDTDFPDWVKPKVSTDVGKVTAVVPQDGVALVTWQPPSAYAGGTVAFRVRYKSASGTKVDTTVELKVPASPARAITAVAEPPVIAPDVQSTMVRFTPPPSGQVSADRQFVATTSFGTLGPVTVAADGTATVEWRRPPSVKKPTMALVTLVDKADPRRRGKVELPVQVAQSTTFTVPPDAKVSVLLGDETIGPVQASPAGTVAFDLRLDPRVTEGRLTGRTPHGDTVEQKVTLPNTSTPVVHFAPIPGPAQHGPGAPSLPIAVATWTPPGSKPVEVTPEASSGTYTPGPDRDDGWVVGRLTPGTAAETVALTARADGASSGARLVVERGLLRVAGEVSPTSFSGTARDVTFTGRALAPDNSEVTDTVGVSVVSGTVISRPSRRGTTTTARARRDRDADAVALLTAPPGSVAGQPVSAVLPWLVPVDEDTLLLRVAVVDALGRAIVKQQVELEAVGASVEGLPETVTTDGYGMAHVSIPRPDGAFGIAAHTAGKTGGAAVTPTGARTAGGDPSWRRALDRWTAAAPVFVVREESAPVVAAAPPAPPAPPDDPPAVADQPDDAPAPAAREPRPKPDASSGDPSWLRAAAAFQGGSYTLETSQSDGTVGPLGVERGDDGLNTGGLQGFVLAWPGGGAIGVEVDGRIIQGDFASDHPIPFPDRCP